MPPLFEFSDHFDAIVQIGDKALPIKVKRYLRDEMDALSLRYDRLFATRGTADLDDAAKAAREKEARTLIEDLIIEGVSLDEGLIVDRGRSVVDGRGLIAIFHQRKDVLSELAAAVVIENKLGSLAKNSNSRRGSDPFSEQSSPARRGDGQGSTADGVEHSISAPTGDAMVPSNQPEEGAALESSGTASEAMAVG